MKIATSTFYRFLLAIILLTLVSVRKSYGQEEPLHFAHPLTTESISPDTKFRLNYNYTKMQGGSSSNEYGIELEYSPDPAISIRLETPYVSLNPENGNSVSHFDNIELALKFANFSFADKNILTGYGINFGLPTGSTRDGIGSNHIANIEPFLNGGYKWHNLELTAFFTFGIPTNQHSNESIETEFNMSFAAVYLFSPKWQGVLETGRGSELSGPNPSNQNWDYTAGVKFQPNPDLPWIFAAGIRHALGNNEELDYSAEFSLFYHFKD